MAKIVFWDVDTQIDFIEPEGKLYVTGSERIKPNLSKLTEYASNNKITIIGSVDFHSEDDPEIEQENPDFQETFPPHCLKGEKGSEKIEESLSKGILWVNEEELDEESLENLLEQKKPIYLRKTRFDVFHNPNTEKIVKLINPEKIFVYGVAADVCVKFAVEGLMNHKNFELFVVTDAIKGIDPQRTEELLKEWKEKGVQLVTTEEVLNMN